MKTTYRSLIACTVLVMAAIMPSCKNKNKVAMPAPGEELVQVYCSGESFFSDKKFFRANAVGESLDQAISKKKAMSNARADLASAVQTTIKATIDNYMNSREFNNKEEVEERFEGLTREVINQQLRGTKTICEKITKTTEGTYKTYIALELSGDKMASALQENLSKDERLKIDYDYEKFKKTFEEEMNKLENK